MGGNNGMNEGNKGKVLMTMMVSKVLRRRFMSACKERDVAASVLLRDYMEKQLAYWEKQQSEKPWRPPNT